MYQCYGESANALGKRVESPWWGVADGAVLSAMAMGGIEEFAMASKETICYFC